VPFHPPGAFSDHSGAHIHIGNNRPPGCRPFKFFNMWVDHPEYDGLISDGWQIPVVSSPMFVLCRKLKSLKHPLKTLSKLHFNHISERVARAEVDLDHNQCLLHDSIDDISLMNKVNQMKLNLFNLKYAEKAFFSEKLKWNFLKDNDRGTSFFHALMSHRHQKSFILAIQCSNGELTTSIDEVSAEFVHFYQNLLGTSSTISPINEAVVHSGPCLDVNHSDFLLAPISNEAIKETLFSIGIDKAPGPDSYSSLFFKKSWDIVNADFYATVQDFFSSRQILKHINHSIVALVPKSANVNSANVFRPISCCNVIYKVISKILAGRLSHALQDIIGPAQNAFLGGQNMIDNINLAQELLRHYGRKRTSPRCLIKVDFRKAFNSVQWPFLRDLLHLLGFPQRFVHLVMLCVETSSFLVAINGNLYGFFPGKCGVWQGDPLSPYLFLVCIECNNPTFQAQNNSIFFFIYLTHMVPVISEPDPSHHQDTIHTINISFKSESYINT